MDAPGKPILTPSTGASRTVLSPIHRVLLVPNGLPCMIDITKDRIRPIQPAIKSAPPQTGLVTQNERRSDPLDPTLEGHAPTDIDSLRRETVLSHRYDLSIRPEGMQQPFR